MRETNIVSPALLDDIFTLVLEMGHTIDGRKKGSIVMYGKSFVRLKSHQHAWQHHPTRRVLHGGGRILI
jgi:hypothetical protein